MKNFKYSLLLFLVLNLVPAAAQLITSNNSSNKDATSLGTVVVQGHYANGVGSSDSSSSGTISGQLIEDMPLLRPGQVLEDVPGMVVTQHSGDGKANQYFLRGYNLDHGTDFASSIEGVPVNMPTNAHGQGYADLNYLIPELIDRIDYKKGPYFSGYGDFSSAGVADIHMKSSLDRNIFDLTLGSFDYRRLLMAGSQKLYANLSDGSINPNSSLNLLGALELLDENGPWVVPEGLHKINGLIKLSDGNVANGWSLTGNYYTSSWRSTDQVPLDLIQSGQLCLYCSLSPTDGGESGRAIVSGEWHEHDSSGYTKINSYFQHYRLNLWSDFTFFELRPASGDQFEQFEDRNIVGGSFVKSWDHKLVGRESTTEVGLQLRHDNIHVGLLNTQARVTFATVSNDLVSETMTSLYAQESTIWSSSLRTLIGVRADDVYMDMNSLSLATNSGSANGAKVSPKFSLILGPWDRTEYFFNAGRGLHSNDARGVINKVDPTTGTASNSVPPLVGSFGQEIGLRTEAIENLQSSLALWTLQSNSEIIYSADSGIGSTTPNGASKRVGVEWNNHYNPRSWLLIDANLAWTRARYETMNDNGQLGDMIPNAVNKVGLLSVTARNIGPWSGSLQTRYIGSYPLTQDGSQMAPDALVTNLKVQRALDKDTDVALDILNLFNRHYYDIAYNQDYQTTAYNPATLNLNGITVHPGEPREYRVTLKYKF